MALPPPSTVPDDAPEVAPPPARPPRPGELTLSWLVAFTVAWIGVAVGFAAVWNTSRQLGLSTWWLGPPAQQRPFFVVMLPFVAPVLMVLAAVNRRRHLPVMGLAAAAVTAAVGVADLGRVRGLGVVELCLAGAGAAVSVAAFGGRYRAATDRDGGDDGSPTEPAATP